jgi:hypothetical protein
MFIIPPYDCGRVLRRGVGLHPLWQARPLVDLAVPSGQLPSLDARGFARIATTNAARSAGQATASGWLEGSSVHRERGPDISSGEIQVQDTQVCQMEAATVNGSGGPLG